MRIIVGTEGGGESTVEHAVFFCSTSDWAFGPVIYASVGEAGDKAEHFLDYVASVTGGRELRGLADSELEGLYSTFITLFEGDVPCECGHEKDAHSWCSNRRACSAEECDCRGGWQPKKVAVQS